MVTCGVGLGGWVIGWLKGCVARERVRQGEEHFLTSFTINATQHTVKSNRRMYRGIPSFIDKGWSSMSCMGVCPSVSLATQVGGTNFDILSDIDCLLRPISSMVFPEGCWY